MKLSLDRYFESGVMIYMYFALPADLIQFVAAEGEMRASEALKNAANVLAESPSAIQLRYLQTLTTISAEKNSTIIFPLPIEMLKGIVSKQSGENS